MKEHVEVWPNVFGTKNWQPSSFNQKTGLVYANTMNFGWKYKTSQARVQTGRMVSGRWTLADGSSPQTAIADICPPLTL